MLMLHSAASRDIGVGGDNLLKSSAARLAAGAAERDR